MKTPNKISLMTTFILSLLGFLGFSLKAQQCPSESTGKSISSCQGSIEQKWDQKDGDGSQARSRNFYIHVPEKGQNLPVLFIFHGNKGNGQDFLNSFVNRFSDVSEKFVVVAPSGYATSWNIVAEDSKAPDYSFFEELVNYISGFNNIQSNSISLYGVSNGSAFVNNILIRSDDHKIIKAITEVSQLSIKQYHNHKFWKQGLMNQYNESKVPMQGRKIIALTGVQDFVVPPSGGESLIPANNSGTKKLKFLSAQNSALAWAKAMGHSGAKAEEKSYDDSISYWSYLNGQVVHYSFGWDGHSIENDEKIDIISDFLLDRKEKIPSLIDSSSYD